MNNWTPPKRSLYTYCRKSDGHIYEVDYAHESIINKEPFFMFMATNELWETIKVTAL